MNPLVYKISTAKLFRRLLTFAFFTVVPVLSVSLPARAADYCRFYSNDNWTGTANTYEIPSGSHTGQNWGAVSIRRFGSELPDTVRNNAESVRVRAMDSDVVLYVFDGDHFDGNFQAFRVNKGNEWSWRYGAMKNKIRSFICQRDDFIPANLNGLSEFMRNSLLPSYLLADPITAEIHGETLKQRNLFYNLDLKYGRLSWATRHNVCREIDCASPRTTRDKYIDYLKYSYKVSGRLKADAKNYDIYITVWFQPKLQNGNLVFTQEAWKVDVSDWIWSNRIRNEIVRGVEQQYPQMGAMLTTNFRSAVTNILGSQGNAILNGNARLIFSHPCNYYLQRVGYPGHSFTSFQIEDFCGGTTPTSVASPGLRLLK